MRHLKYFGKVSGTNSAKYLYFGNVSFGRKKSNQWKIVET